MVATHELPAGYAVEDAAILHFKNEKLEKTFTLQQGKTAFFVEEQNGTAKETALPAELLS